MAGGGRKVGGGGPRPERHKLTWTRLTEYDDLLTDVMVDKIFYWGQVRKTQPGGYNPYGTADEQQAVRIIREYVINDEDLELAKQLYFQLPGVSKFCAALPTERHRQDFREHFRRYLNVWRVDCPFEVTTTNRFLVKKLEASISARKNVPKGQKISYLEGELVGLTAEEERGLAAGKHDFSVVISSRSHKKLLFLGPARFCNHDCNPNAELNPISNNRMEVRAIRDILIGDEITVKYADDYFAEGNANCLCLTCEMKLEHGWAQYDEKTGERIAPDKTDVEELDQNGNVKRTLRERGLPRDYKERPPSPLPKRGQRRQATEVRAPLQTLSETMVVIDDSYDGSSSEATLVVDEDEDDEEPPSPPRRPSPPPRRVPRKQPTLPADQDLHTFFIFNAEPNPDWCVEGSTDDESGDVVKLTEGEGAQTVPAEDYSIVSTTTSSTLVLEDMEVVGHGPALHRMMDSTPPTSVDLDDSIKYELGSSSEAKSHGNRTSNSGGSSTPNPFRSVGTIPPLQNGSQNGIATARMVPLTTNCNGSKHGELKNILSGGANAMIKVDQSESEGDVPIGRMFGAMAATPWDVDSDAPIPTQSLMAANLNKNEGGLGADAPLNAAALASIGPKESGTKRKRGRTSNASRAREPISAVNFYGSSGGRARTPLPIPQTPDASPPKIEKPPSAHLRRLRGEPTPDKKPMAAFKLTTTLVTSGLHTLDESDEGEDADSESHAAESPSKHKRRRLHNDIGVEDVKENEQEEEEGEEKAPLKRTPMDYLLTPLLLPNESSAWVDCVVCKLPFICTVPKSEEQKYCPRCVRHAKMYGLCWPETYIKEEEQRCDSWTDVLMAPHWSKDDTKTARVGTRGLEVQRVAKKRAEMQKAKDLADGRLVAEENDEENKPRDAKGADLDDADVEMGETEADITAYGDQENIYEFTSDDESDWHMDWEPLSTVERQQSIGIDGSSRPVAEASEAHDDDEAARQLLNESSRASSPESEPSKQSESNIGTIETAMSTHSISEEEGVEDDATKDASDRAAERIPESLSPEEMKEIERQIRACLWDIETMKEPCTCGLVAKVKEEFVSGRLDISNFGMFEIISSLHSNEYRHDGMEFLGPVSIKRAQSIIDDHRNVAADGTEPIWLATGTALISACRRSAPR